MREDKDQIDIFKSVKSDAISELTPELLDTGLDLATDSDVIKDIPVFGSVFKVFAIYKKVKESFFTRKLLKFLIELKEIPLSDREKFINEIESDKQTKRAGEKLLLALARYDDDEKATVIGRLFKFTILGKIEYKDFNRLTHIIDYGFLDDIKLLKNNEYLGYISEEIKFNLSQLGLVKQSISDVKKQKKILEAVRLGGEYTVQPKFEYKINSIGLVLIKYGFD